MTNTVTNGSDLMLFLNGKSIAFATNHTLGISVETVETSSKDNGGGKWTSKAARKISWTVSSENLYCLKNEGPTQNQGNTYDDLFDLLVARNPIDIVFSVEAQYQSKPDEVPEGGWTPITKGQYKGKAIITSLDVNAPNGDNATLSVSLEGVGALTRTDE